MKNSRDVRAKDVDSEDEMEDGPSTSSGPPRKKFAPCSSSSGNSARLNARKREKRATPTNDHTGGTQQKHEERRDQPSRKSKTPCQICNVGYSHWYHNFQICRQCQKLAREHYADEPQKRCWKRCTGVEIRNCFECLRKRLRKLGVMAHMKKMDAKRQKSGRKRSMKPDEIVYGTTGNQRKQRYLARRNQSPEPESSQEPGPSNQRAEREMEEDFDFDFNFEPMDSPQRSRAPHEQQDPSQDDEFEEPRQPTTPKSRISRRLESRLKESSNGGNASDNDHHEREDASGEDVDFDAPEDHSPQVPISAVQAQNSLPPADVRSGDEENMDGLEKQVRFAEDAPEDAPAAIPNAAMVPEYAPVERKVDEDDWLYEIVGEGADRLIKEKAEGYKGIKDVNDVHPRKARLNNPEVVEKLKNVPSLCKVCKKCTDVYTEKLCHDCHGVLSRYQQEEIGEVPKCSEGKICRFYPNTKTNCLECWIEQCTEAMADSRNAPCLVCRREPAIEKEKLCASCSKFDSRFNQFEQEFEPCSSEEFKNKCSKDIRKCRTCWYRLCSAVESESYGLIPPKRAGWEKHYPLRNEGPLRPKRKVKFEKYTRFLVRDEDQRVGLLVDVLTRK